MGLALAVGVLAELKEVDPEGFEFHAAALERLSRYMKSCNLPLHQEPEDCEVWSGQMIGYSGLHDLRRIAAYLDAGALRIPVLSATTTPWMEFDRAC
jgi:hypothetical protein